MSHVSIPEVATALEAEDVDHREVLDAGPLTVEVGRYPPGTAAPQNPHNEEELYYVVSGSGKLRVGDETHSLEAGDVVYVEPGLEHDFFDIEEEIVTMIIFGPSVAPSSYAIREERER